MPSSPADALRSAVAGNPSGKLAVPDSYPTFRTHTPQRAADTRFSEKGITMEHRSPFPNKTFSQAAETERSNSASQGDSLATAVVGGVNVRGTGFPGGGGRSPATPWAPPRS